MTYSAGSVEAERFYARGDLRNALRRSLDHLERRPWDQSAARIAALCLSRLDFANEAEPYYVKSGGPSRLDLDQSQIRALALVRANQREAAVVAYQTILERWPTDPLALQRLATLYLSQKRYPDALVVAGQLAAIPGKEVIGYALLGTIAHQDDVPEDAASAYEKVFELDPTLKQIPFPASLFWTEFISDLARAGRTTDARRFLAKALSRLPEDVELLEFEGAIAFRQGEMDAAERSWNGARNVDPSRPRAWLGLGQIALRQGKVDEAIVMLAKAAALAPNDPEAPYQLSLAHRQKGQPGEADRLLKLSEQIRIRSKIQPKGMGAMPATRS